MAQYDFIWLSSCKTCSSFTICWQSHLTAALRALFASASLCNNQLDCLRETMFCFCLSRHLTSDLRPSLSLLLHSSHCCMQQCSLCCLTAAFAASLVAVDTEQAVSITYQHLCVSVKVSAISMPQSMPQRPDWLCTHLLKSAAALQTSKNLFILIPSLLGALLTLMALAVCGLFPRYMFPF